MRIAWSKISLFFLFVVALIGTLLRSTAYLPLPVKFTNLVHAHSHVAFQGWIYTIMVLLLVRLYLKKHQIHKGRYPLQFKLTVLIILGVLITFALQGYALYSILFSTLFQLLNYWFIFRFLKDLKEFDHNSTKILSLRFVKTGLYFGLLSTIVPYGIGVLSVKGLGASEAYRSLVYTFLHLQYNGWFLFVALGLFYKFLEDEKIYFRQKPALIFYWLMTLAVLPAIALSLLGMSFSKYMVVPAYFATALQGFGLLFFLKSLWFKLFDSLRQKSRWFQWYLTTFLVTFFIKQIVQCLSVLPVFRAHTFNNKLIILAYLHLSLIGVISFLFIALMIKLKWLDYNTFSRAGNALFLSGFIITELLLALGGIGWHYNPSMLSVGSAAMALGILLLVFSRKSQKEAS